MATLLEDWVPRVVTLDVDIESGDPLRRNGLVEGLQVIGGVPLDWRCALESDINCTLLSLWLVDYKVSISALCHVHYVATTCHRSKSMQANWPQLKIVSPNNSFFLLTCYHRYIVIVMQS